MQQPTFDESFLKFLNTLSNIFSKGGYIILLVIIILLLMQTCNGNRDMKRYREENLNLQNALADNLKTFRNKDSLQVAKISVLETEHIEDFLILQSQDSVINQLQAQVKKFKRNLDKGSSVTVINNTTEANLNTGVEVTKSDTIKTSDTTVICPTEFTINPVNLDGWILVEGKVTQDSANFHVLVRNTYTVVVGYEKGKPFFKRKPFVEIINDNPFTETKSMRAYQVKIPPPKRFGIGVTVGYGLVFDVQRLRIGHGVFAGVSFNYNIINIK